MRSPASGIPLTHAASGSTFQAQERSARNGASVAQSAIDVISPAFEHAKKQLFQPFNFVPWARIAFLAMATGEMRKGSGCNAHLPTSFPNPHTQQNFLDSPADFLKSIDPALIGTLVLVALIGGIVLVLVWLYVSSISRFVLYETVGRPYC